MFKGDLGWQTGSKKVAVIAREKCQGSTSSHCSDVAEESAKTEAIKGDVVVADA